jgi:fumarate hydratase class II
VGPLRIEYDSSGPVEIEIGRYWGAQTQRSLVNFDIGRDRFRWGRPVIQALGLVKGAAAQANLAFGLLDPVIAGLISAASAEVADGHWDDEFPLVVWQTGSGTQTNMNANEVIANRAIELAGGVIGSRDPVHPNDHVNRSQSSNDVFPTVMHVATITELRDRLYPAVTDLLATLHRLATEHARLVKVGRTHLQDATPITLGQEIGGWAAQIEAGMAAVHQAEDRLRHDLAIGGTATGTGVNSPAGFGPAVAAQLSDMLGVGFSVTTNHFAATSAHDAMVGVSAALRTLAGGLTKMANDVRWLASGPRTGIGELELPANEPGSSIMPGKVNPTQAEALTMVAAQVFGNDTTVALAGAQGSFQLNTYKPVILHNVLESIALVADGTRSFDQRCAQGLRPNRAVITRHLEANLMVVTALSPHIGYDRAAEVAKVAAKDGISLLEAGVALGYLAPDDYHRWVDLDAMTRPDPSPASG